MLSHVDRTHAARAEALAIRTLLATSDADLKTVRVSLPPSPLRDFLFGEAEYKGNVID